VEVVYACIDKNSELELKLLRFKHEPATLTVLNKVIFDIISDAVKGGKQQITITDDIKNNNVELNQLLEKYGFLYVDDRWIKYNLSTIFNDFSELQNTLQLDEKYKHFPSSSNPEVVFWPCKVLGYCSTFIVLWNQKKR